MAEAAATAGFDKYTSDSKLPIRPLKLRFVVAMARSPPAKIPMCPPKHGPQVGGPTIQPASIKISISPSSTQFFQIRGVSGALYRALEFSGSAVEALGVEGRMTMANMAIEAGGKVGLFAADQKTLDFVQEAGVQNAKILTADAGAEYERCVAIDVTDMQPQIACPHLPDNVCPVDELQDVCIHQAVIGSCTNGRINDMREAASVLKGQKVDPKVRCIILPATPRIWKNCVEEGLMEIFMEAGCIVGPPTCGPCLGGHMGILAGGERAIATTNRNFKGRMGSLESEVYLSNPAVAAASAIAGKIVHPNQI